MKKTNRRDIVTVASLLFIAFLIDAPFVLAQEKKENLIKLNIQKAISMAFDSSENLKISENAVLRKTSQKKEELADGLPQISAEMGWSNYFEYPDIAATAAMKDYYADAGVSLSQTLFAFGRIYNAVSAANRAVEASRFNRESTRQDIIYTTKLSYFNTLLAKRISEIAEESYRNAQQNKKILEDRSAQGRVSKYDNIKISADVSSRLPAVNNARANFISTLETLKMVIGASRNDTIELIEGFAQQFSEFDRETLALALFNNQPAIKALAMTIKEKEALVRSKKAALLPEISAFGTWNHKGYGDSYYVGGDHMDDYGVAGLMVSIPLWLGGTDQEKLSQARIDYRDAELQYTKGQKDYLLELDKAISEYQEHLKTLEANNEALRLAKEAFTYSQELFGSGQVSVTDLNDSELQLTNAKISKERTLFNLNMALARIERLTLMGERHE
jgi:outer membrane protein TolC